METILREFEKLEHLQVFLHYLRVVPKEVDKRWINLQAYMQKVTGAFYQLDKLQALGENLECYLDIVQDKTFMFSDQYLQAELIDFQKSKPSSIKEPPSARNIAFTFLPKETDCCGKKLSPKPLQTCTYFRYGQPGVLASLYRSVCATCHSKFYPSYYEDKEENRFYYDPADQDVIVFTLETAIEKKLLHALDIDLLRKHTNWEGFADSFNDLNACLSDSLHGPEAEIADMSEDTPTCPIRSLHRKRLGDFWNAWSILKWCVYLEKLSTTPLNLSSGQSIDAHALELIPEITTAFTKKWTGSYHRDNCKHPECSKAFGMDGHFKCKRSVCDARDEVFITCTELGHIPVGCPKTPMLGSFYCAEHHERTAVKPKPVEEPSINRLSLRSANASKAKDEDSTNNTTKSKRFRNQPSSSAANRPLKSSDRFVVSDILESRINPRTLKCEYFVQWEDDSTDWVSSENVSSKLIEEFAKNSRAARAKKRQGDVFELSSEEKEELENMTCNTFKQNQRGPRKHRTAGICAAIFNCGITFGLRELLGSESISQVYAFLVWLHDTAVEMPDHMFYDDACHLVRFIKNPKRPNSTSASLYLLALVIVLDRMHFENHTDPWCVENLDPDLCEFFKGINTEACEQEFSWLCNYKHSTRHMNFPRFNLFLLTLCDLSNEKKLQRKY